MGRGRESAVERKWLKNMMGALWLLNLSCIKTTTSKTKQQQQQNKNKNKNKGFRTGHGGY